MEHLFEIDRILIKYVRNEILTPDETVFLQQWLHAADGREEMIDNIKNETDWMKEGLKKMQESSNSRTWEKLTSRLEAEGSWSSEALIAPVIPISNTVNRRRWRSLVAATVIFAAAGATFWGLQQRHNSISNSNEQSKLAVVRDALPGTNRAVLTLSNGQRINLDSSHNGVLASEANMKVTKLADGQLAYNKIAEAKPSVPTYNTLSTPRAGQFSLTLPDGSRVWLNNASSLLYPVSFTGKSREVQLTGEAYFEIAKDVSHPFKVTVHKANQTSSIEVLGTSFNIMAYDDETVERTTLVDGSVRFIHKGANSVLKPEEQSVLEEDGAIKTLHHINVSEVTAWKNGYFHFDHASLETTMRQIARWYDVDVEYAGHVAPQEFMGKIQRNLPLFAVLKGLENEHIHFQLEGRKLLVKP